MRISMFYELIPAAYTFSICSHHVHGAIAEEKVLPMWLEFGGLVLNMKHALRHWSVSFTENTLIPPPRVCCKVDDFTV